MSDEHDVFHETEVEAHNTKCPDCGANFEVVRPGKIQPTCLCEAYRFECERRTEAEQDRDHWRQRAEAAESASSDYIARTDPLITKLTEAREQAEQQRDAAVAALTRVFGLSECGEWGAGYEALCRHRLGLIREIAEGAIGRGGGE